MGLIYLTHRSHKKEGRPRFLVVRADRGLFSVGEGFLVLQQPYS